MKRNGNTPFAIWIDLETIKLTQEGQMTCDITYRCNLNWMHMNKFTKQKHTHRLRKTNSELPKGKEGAGGGVKAGLRRAWNAGNKPHTLLNTQVGREKQSMLTRVCGIGQAALPTLLSSVGRESTKNRGTLRLN